MGDFVKVAPPEAIAKDGDAVHVEVAGRKVSVILKGGTMYCMDAACYHAGGPLTIGDIEEVAGRQCIICPWHKYYVTLDTGEGLYQSAQFDDEGKLKPGPWSSKGVKQRVHKAERRGDGIYVQLLLEGAVQSDDYSRPRRKKSIDKGR